MSRSTPSVRPGYLIVAGVVFGSLLLAIAIAVVGDQMKTANDPHRQHHDEMVSRIQQDLETGRPVSEELYIDTIGKPNSTTIGPHKYPNGVAYPPELPDGEKDLWYGSGLFGWGFPKFVRRVGREGYIYREWIVREYTTTATH